MRFQPGEDDQAFAKARGALLDEFDAWVAANRPPDDGQLLVNAGIFLDWRYTYSTGVLDDYRESDLAEFLLEWCPRKLSAPPEDAPAVCRAVAAFIEFLHASGRLAGGPGRAARLITVAEELVAEMVIAMGDESKYGMAKSLFAGPFCDALDLDESVSPEELQAALDARMEAFNALPFEERKSLTDRALTPALTKLVELPFVHVPPPAAAVAASAAGAPILAKIHALREYLGADGKALTDRGNLKLADGRALVELLETGDIDDRTIGDQTLKTTSTDELRHLVFIVDIAKRAGAVRVNKRRLVPVKAWSRRPLVERAAAAFSAVIELGPLWSIRRHSVPLFDAVDQLLDDGILHWLAGLLAPDGERRVDEIVEMAQELVTIEIVPRWPLWPVESLEQLAARDVCYCFGVLELVGVVQWTDRRHVTDRWGHSHPIGGVVTLTALGHNVTPEHLPAAGYRLRSVGDLTGAGAEALIEAIDWVSADELDGLIAAWQPQRTPAERAELLTAAVAAANDARSRLAGLAAIDVLGADVAAPYVRQLLDSPAAGHAALWLMSNDLADEDLLATFVNVGTFVDILAATIDDPDEMCELFTSAPSADQPDVMLQQMWRHPGPETAAVLDALGRHLPDRKLAKSARKAAMQHRSWMANRR